MSLPDQNPEDDDFKNNPKESLNRNNVCEECGNYKSTKKRYCDQCRFSYDLTD